MVWRDRRLLRRTCFDGLVDINGIRLDGLHLSQARRHGACDRSAHAPILVALPLDAANELPERAVLWRLACGWRTARL